MKLKKRIPKKDSVEQILKMLRKGYATRAILENIRKNWELPDTTFYNHLKEARQTYDKEQAKAQKEIERVRVEEAKKAAQNGLKSKYERDIEIQNEIDYYQSILRGEKKVSFILGQKVSKTESLPIQIVVLVQNAINDLRKELSKRLGEYAAEKHDINTTVRAFPIFDDENPLGVE